MPKGSIGKFLVKEAHEEGLMEHFGVQLTLDLLDKHLFWPHMKHNVNKFCENCIVCKKSKSKVKCNDPPRRHDIITQKRKKILDF